MGNGQTNGQTNGRLPARSEALAMGTFVKELDLLTQQFLNGLQTISFEEINDFVDRREGLLNQIKSSEYSSAELVYYKPDIERILHHDPIIINKMQELQSEASQALDKFKLGHTQKNAYNASYSLDGVYFDKKK